MKYQLLKTIQPKQTQTNNYKLPMRQLTQDLMIKILNRLKAQIVLAFIIIFCFSHKLSAQENEFKVPENLHIDSTYCYLQFYSNETAKKFYNLFNNVKNERVYIYHYGASHIQAEILTTRTRSLLQNDFGDAGRGLIFNYGAAKTYSSVNYASTAKGIWRYAKSFQIPPKIPLGIMGMTVETYDQQASLDFVFKKEISKDDYKLYLLFDINDATPDIKITIDNSVFLFTEKERSILNGKNYYALKINQAINEIHIDILPTHEAQKFTFYGINIEKNTNGGLVYHSLGVGAAPFESVLYLDKMAEHAQLFKPDIVILDFGTNNILYKNTVYPKVKNNIVQAIEKFRSVNPDVIIVLTSTQDLFYKKRFIDAAITFTSLIDSIAQEHDCMFWNWYDLSGGYGTIRTWHSHGYAQKDHIHLTMKGYNLKGYLLYKSLINSLDEIQKDPSISHFCIDPKKYDAKITHSLPSSSQGTIKYKIKKGDTLSSIARRHNTSVAQLKKINNLKSDLIREGSYLIIKK